VAADRLGWCTAIRLVMGDEPPATVITTRTRRGGPTWLRLVLDREAEMAGGHGNQE